MSNSEYPLHLAGKKVLSDLSEVLLQLTPDQFSQPSKHLSGATIGQHTRHILELYIELFAGYEQGIVDYDQRKRNKTIEQDRSFAAACLDEISEMIVKANKPLELRSTLDGGITITINTDYDRELLYNLEHAIHHMALIRIGINELTQIALPGHFGVASGTIQYRQQICVQ